MKKQVWDLLFYAIMFGFAYYQTYGEELYMTAMFAVLAIGAVQIISTFFSIAAYGMIWFWDATVNYNKNRKKEIGDEE